MILSENRYPLFGIMLQMSFDLPAPPHRRPRLAQMRFIRSVVVFAAILGLVCPRNGTAFAQTAAADCKLDAARLFIGARATYARLPQVIAGQAYRLALFEQQGPAIRDVAPECFQWQFDPQDGVSFDAPTGLLQVLDNAASGRSVRIGARIADRSPGHASVVGEEIRMARLDENPLLGLWREVPPARCAAKGSDQALDRIRELEFRANGSFLVTWQPFETYVDYWGRYAFSKPDTTLVLSIENGNFIPAGFQGAGSFEISPDGRLGLKGIRLGSKSGAKAMDDVECGRSFEPVRR
jgi:hypothetical protein